MKVGLKLSTDSGLKMTYEDIYDYTAAKAQL